jgi:ribosomal protein S21
MTPPRFPCPAARIRPNGSAMRLHSDPVTNSPRILVDPQLGGVDAAIRRLRSTVDMPALRRRTHFVGPAEQRREKHRRALRRMRRQKPGAV